MNLGIEDAATLAWLISTGETGRYTGPDDRAELGKLLGLDGPVHCQGENVPSGGDYWDEYIDRAEGRTPAKVGVPYWD